MTIREIRDWYRARPGYWFRPKLFGWGAVPVTWQGWAATFTMIVAATAVARFAEVRDLALLVLLVPLVAAFSWLCWLKTDGDWRWRWGDTD
jgi:hypothetical protein